MPQTSSVTIAHTGGDPVTVTRSTTAAGDGAAHSETISLSPESAVKEFELDEHTTISISNAKPAAA